MAIDRFQATANINTQPDFGGKTSFNSVGQAIASAKDIGATGIQLTQQAQEVFAKKQKQLDTESALSNIAKLTLTYDEILERESQSTSDLPLLERVQTGMRDATAEHTQENAFTPGARVLFAEGAIRAQAFAGGQALNTQQAMEKVRRVLEFKNATDIFAGQAYKTGSTAAGLEIFLGQAQLLDIAQYDNATKEKLMDELRLVARSTAEGVLDQNPDQLLADIDAGRYNGTKKLPILHQKTIEQFRDKAVKEIEQRLVDGAVQRNKVAAGQLEKTFLGGGTLGPEDFQKTYPKIEDQRSHERELRQTQDAASIRFGEGPASVDDSRLAEFLNEVKTGPDIDAAYGLKLYKKLVQAREQFEKEYKADKVGTLLKTDPQLKTKYAEMSKADMSNLELSDMMKKRQIARGTHVNDVQTFPLDFVDDTLADMRAPLDKINITTLDHVGRPGQTEMARQTAMALRKTLGSQRFQEFIHDAKVIATDRSRVPDRFWIAISMADNPAAYNLLATTSAMSDELVNDLVVNVDERKALEQGILEDDDLQAYFRSNRNPKEADALKKAIRDAAFLVSYNKKTTNKDTVVDEIKDVFLSGLNFESIPMGSGGSQSIIFDRELSGKESSGMTDLLTDFRSVSHFGIDRKASNFHADTDADFQDKFIAYSYPVPMGKDKNGKRQYAIGIDSTMGPILFKNAQNETVLLNDTQMTTNPFPRTGTPWDVIRYNRQKAARAGPIQSALLLGLAAEMNLVQGILEIGTNEGLVGNEIGGDIFDLKEGTGKFFQDNFKPEIQAAERAASYFTLEAYIQGLHNIKEYVLNQEDILDKGIEEFNKAADVLEPAGLSFIEELTTVTNQRIIEHPTPNRSQERLAAFEMLEKMQQLNGIDFEEAQEKYGWGPRKLIEVQEYSKRVYEKLTRNGALSKKEKKELEKDFDILKDEVSTSESTEKGNLYKDINPKGTEREAEVEYGKLDDQFRIAVNALQKLDSIKFNNPSPSAEKLRKELQDITAKMGALEKKYPKIGRISDGNKHTKMKVTGAK
jgi:hypothetical protein